MAAISVALAATEAGTSAWSVLGAVFVVALWVLLLAGACAGLINSKWFGTTFRGHEDRDYHSTRRTGRGYKGGYYTRTTTTYRPPSADEADRRRRKTELEQRWPRTKTQEADAQRWRFEIVDAIRRGDVDGVRRLVLNQEHLPPFLYWDGLDPDLEGEAAVAAIREHWTCQALWGTKPGDSTDAVRRTTSNRAKGITSGTRCACGGKFVVRSRRSDGKRFLGCSNFPSCRETRRLGR